MLPSILVHMETPSASPSFVPTAFPSIRGHLANSGSFFYECKHFKGSSPLSANKMHNKPFVDYKMLCISILFSVFHIFSTLQFLLKTKSSNDANEHFEK